MMTIPIWLYLFSVAMSAFLGFMLCMMIGLVEWCRELDRLIKKYQLPRTGEGDKNVRYEIDLL